MAIENRFDDVPIEQREAVAENMKERIYSTITLLAVLTVMWQNTEHRSTIGTISTIVGSVMALWMATLIAIRISYRAVHGKPISRAEYVEGFFTSSGLLAPAVPPILIVLVSGVTSWYSLHTALLASMVVSLMSLFTLSFIGGRKIYNNTWRLIMVSTLETLVGVGVIVLKLAVGE